MFYMCCHQFGVTARDVKATVTGCRGNRQPSCADDLMIAVVFVHATTHADGKHNTKDLETGDSDPHTDQYIGILQGHIQERLLTALEVVFARRFVVTGGGVPRTGGVHIVHGGGLVGEDTAGTWDVQTVLDQVVVVRVIVFSIVATAIKLDLDERPGPSQHGAVGVLLLDRLLQDFVNLLFDLDAVEDHEGSSSHLPADDEDKEEDVEAQQTFTATNGTAAAAESHEKHERSKRNQDVGCILEVGIARVDVDHVEVATDVLVDQKPNSHSQDGSTRQPENDVEDNEHSPRNPCTTAHGGDGDLCIRVVNPHTIQQITRL